MISTIAASKSVLVVEDDRDIRETLKGLLDGDGYDVGACSNGMEALELLRGGRETDVILLDLMMPVMDGWEFRVQQKRDPHLASIPVLVLSADGTAKAAAIDADGYLRKPIDYAKLIGTIERTLAAAERRRLQASLVETEKLASLGTMAAGLAHEINNPLTYVIANLDYVALALQGGAGLGGGSASADEKLHNALRDSRDGCDRIRSIVRDLQLFSRDTGDEKSEIDVRRILDSSANIVMHEIRPRARLTRDYGEVPLFAANAVRLGQVFLNLVLNAAQAIAPGDPEKNEIRLTTRSRGSTVVVEVRDTGEGIPPEIRGKIFDPFFTTKPLGVGTGLGLSISHRLVSAMKGELTVTSEPGRGSTFRIELPMTGRHGSGARTPAPAPVKKAQRARLLVIDDEPLIGSMIARVLEGSHDVESMTNPDEAVARIARGERFDLILCDVMMPERSGIDVHAAIDLLAPEQARRMMFLTGGAFTPRAREFLAQRESMVVPKPFAVDELVARITSTLAAFEPMSRTNHPKPTS